MKFLLITTSFVSCLDYYISVIIKNVGVLTFLMYNFLMKFLGIDYGTKNIGLAVSDDNGQFAIDIPVMKNSEKVFEGLKQIIKDKKIEGIVMGLPGLERDNEITLKIRKFGIELESLSGIEVRYWDESYSSINAEKGLRGKKRKNSDSRAARMILQEFLDFNSAKR